MEKINLKQLWKIAKRENQPLLGLTTDLTTLDFMSDYLQKNEAFDRDIARERGFFAPVWNLEDEDDADDVFEQWQKDVFYFLYKNKENYQRLYDLLSITYDPLCNYDKTSVITDQESGTDTDTNVIGARHREDSYAQKQNTDAYGAVSHTDIHGQREDSTVYGAQSQTDQYGATSETDTNGQKITGTEYGATSQSTQYGATSESTEYGATSESTQYGAVSNSDTIGARTDSTTHGAQTNTDNFGAVSEATTHGSKTTTSTEKIAGFNSATFVNSNSGDVSEGQQADTHTAQARTDSHTTAQYIDSNSVGAQTNSHTENTRTDTKTGTLHTDTKTGTTHTDTTTGTTHNDTVTEGQQINTKETLTHSDTHSSTSHTDTDTIGSQTNTHSETAKTDTHTEGAHKDEFDEDSATDELTKVYGHKNTHNERTTGNIGVTTSQQMAQSEIDLWNSFRFYDILIGDIVKNLCTYGDTGADFF